MCPFDAMKCSLVPIDSSTCTQRKKHVHEPQLYLHSFQHAQYVDSATFLVRYNYCRVFFAIASFISTQQISLKFNGCN